MGATFDAATGVLMQPASGLFVLVVLGAGLAFYIWSRKNHPEYEKLEDAFKAELADLKARAGASFPVFYAELKAKFEELKARLPK